MKLIVAVNEADWGIGHKGDLLARIPEDLAYFQQLTTGKVVVLGSLTLDTFPGGRPLKNRINIILNADPEAKVSGAIVVNSLEELFGVVSRCIPDEVYVSGGASVYEQLLPYCTEAYVTKLNFAVACPSDRYFPNLDEMLEWTCSQSSEVMCYEDIAFTFDLYTNASPRAIA